MGTGQDMLVRDVMQDRVLTVHLNDSVSHLCQVLQAENVNGVPVVGDGSELVGVVTEEDVLYGRMGRPAENETDGAPAPKAPEPPPLVDEDQRVRDIMTAPAVCATEETKVLDLCRMMWRFRIHRIPIVREGRVTGIVSSMDLVRAISEGRIKT